MARSYPEGGRPDGLVLQCTLVPAAVAYGSPTSVAGLVEPARKRFDAGAPPPPPRAEAVSPGRMARGLYAHVLKGCMVRANAACRTRLDKDSRAAAARAAARASDADAALEDVEQPAADAGDVEQSADGHPSGRTTPPSHQRSLRPAPRAVGVYAPLPTTSPTSSPQPQPRVPAAATAAASRPPPSPQKRSTRPVAVVAPPQGLPEVCSPRPARRPVVQRQRSWSADLAGDLEPYPDEDIDEFGYGQFVYFDAFVF
ncbi:hypothetical protein M885DRAFT_505443 [Pelagophyceae sp. CCMP2097]|nr:hypothetical protein M885DRAFT_505443 [Pelagophyceae sp. CCMP2097]